MARAFQLKDPKSREFLGGDLLAQSLSAVGVKVAFGLHGGHLDAFLIGCEDAAIELIDTRHETVAVQAAEGYAKVSGNPGICFVTANSGFCNGIPGIATAFADRSPIICITSSPPARDAETNALQGLHDQVVLSKPITKFAHRVTTVEEIPRIVAYALRTAVSGAPGPVVLDCPIDVLFSPPSRARISWGSITCALPFPPAPSPAGIDAAVALWRQAERPCIITGTGARGAEFNGDLGRLADTTNTPVFYSSKFSYQLPSYHPLRGGPAKNLASLAATGKKQPDLVILLGARTGFLLGSRSGAILPNESCKFIQVDVDGSEIGRSHPIDVGIVSDSAQATKSFLVAFEQSNYKAPAAWVQTAIEAKKNASPHENEPEEVSPKRIHPYHAVKAVFDALEPGAIISIDGGEAGGWALDLVERARPHLVIGSTGYLGFLGNGWGYALGASVADPTRQVVNMQGDGSAGFHLTELDTYARFKRNILTVVVNNHAWGMSQSGQELIYGTKTPSRQASKLSPGTEYETVASGFQCESARADQLEQVSSAIKRLSTAGRPGLLNLIVADRPIHASTKSMVNNTNSSDWIVVPYYDNLPRPHYKS